MRRGVDPGLTERRPRAVEIRPRRIARVVLTAGILLLGLAAAAPTRLEILWAPHGTLRWDRNATPVLLTIPRRGEGYIHLARRFGDNGGAVAAMRAANPGLAAPMRDRPVRIPVEALRSELRSEAVARLFPADRRTHEGWSHLVLDPFDAGGEESWEWLAALFCGRAERAGELRRANPGLTTAYPPRAALVTIPQKLLLAAFRAVPAPVRPTPTATASPGPTAAGAITAAPTRRSAMTPAAIAQRTATATLGGDETEAGDRLLVWDRDAQGEVAVYRLRRGEALYSAVVVRFTGELHAVQVNAMAADIARRSGIDDVTAIPIGFPIKIPFDVLLPQYLPPNHPRRLAWASEERELARFLEVVRAADLKGVHVILDAGHGGGDTGAVVSGAWESTYAYDVMCRIKENLERHTLATVWTTIKDSRRGYSIPARDRLEQHRQQVLLTRPPYTLADSSTGVHLRWILGNDIISHRIQRNVPRAKIVFLSVHADSLHPSVRGSMVYVPSRHMRPSRYAAGRRSLARFEESRRSGEVRLDATAMARAEASSRRLADRILIAVDGNGLEVHPYLPVRDRVKRGRQQYVPAVLRHSLAQHAILLECCNMANNDDRALLLQAEWRERLARAVVEGMAAAFESGS